VLQMSASVSRGGVQLSRGLGSQSGEVGGGGKQDSPGLLRPGILQIPRRGLLPLTSASCRCERRWCATIWPGGQAGRTISDPASLKGLCNMGKHGISAYLTLQLSPMSKVSDEEQEAKCKAIKIINPLIKSLVKCIAGIYTFLLVYKCHRIVFSS